MAEHTPGPWFLENNKIWHDNGLACIAEVFNGILGGSDDLSEAQEANARLITASPNLLAALEALLPVAQAFEKQAGRGVSSRRGGPVFQTRAAIAKARNQGS